MNKEKEKVLAWLQQVMDDIKSNATYGINSSLENKITSVLSGDTENIILYVSYLRDVK